MELDFRFTVTVVVAAASSYLLILFSRRLLDGINKATGGKLYGNKVVKVIGILLDSVLPFLPCVPSGLLTMLVMSYWPPEGLLDNQLLYFLVGTLAGVVSQTLYYAVTRILRKQADRVAAGKVPSLPADPSTPSPGS